MRLLFLGAKGFALVAVALGLVAKLAPELFLHLPMGFLPFMLAGGNKGIVPPYFDIDPWLGDAPREWLRDGDIVVAAGAKAGTTWMCYCMDAIRRKGADDVGLPYTDIMFSTPWMELTQKPGEKWSERQALYNSTILPDGTRLKDYWDNPAFPFRVFKSHYEPRAPGQTSPTAVLPVKEMPNVKYIMTSRAPMEVAKSMHAFFPKHVEAFRKMWGGFPPLYAGPEAAMKDLMPGGTLYGIYFGYLHAWWPYRKEPNVLVLHYTDMIRDHEGLVDKLTKFAGVSLSAEEKGRVMEKCSFAHMKKNNNLFDYKLPLNDAIDTVMKPATFVNKGKSGKAEEGVDPEAIRAFDAAIEAELQDPALKKWALHGGEV